MLVNVIAAIVARAKRADPMIVRGTVQHKRGTVRVDEM